MRPRDSRAAFRAVLDEEFGNSDGELSADEWLGGMKKFCEHMDDKAFEDEIAKLNRVLTANQRAVWRACFGKGNAKQFVLAARAGGATHALFVVDANCAAGPELTMDRKAPDLARKLPLTGTYVMFPVSDPKQGPD